MFGSRRSTGTVLLYTSALFVPLVAFSAVLLALVFFNKVDKVPSTGHDIPGGFYLVDFSATRLIFVSSWSSSVAPKLVGLATALYLFLAAKSLLRLSAASAHDETRLPTPYQLVLLIALSTGSATQLWGYSKYNFKSGRCKNVPILRRMLSVLVLFQILGLLIFAMDSVIHFSTEAVTIPDFSGNRHPSFSFSQGLTSFCANSIDESSSLFSAGLPCTYNLAGTGDGFTNTTEIAATLADLSTSHHLLNITIPDYKGEDQDLVVLGPALDTIPGDLHFKAHSIGVATSCKPVSQACGLNAAYGASTPFHCSDAFSGDIQIPSLDTTSDYWSVPVVPGGTFLYGAEFFDANFSQPYANHSVGTTNSSVVPQYSSLPSTFMMAVVGKTVFGAGGADGLTDDPEIVTPVHGGLAFVLSCNVTTFDVTYDFFNNSIASAEVTQANGTVAWLWNNPMGEAGSTAHLSQGLDAALISPTAAIMAQKWARSFSEEAVAILSSAFEARPNLEESSVTSKIVTKIAVWPLLALVASNVLFAVLGLALGLLVLFNDSAAVSAVNRGLGIEGLVARIFEREGGMIEGQDSFDCFEESNGYTEKVAVEKRDSSKWDFVRTGVESSTLLAK